MATASQHQTKSQKTETEKCKNIWFGYSGHVRTNLAYVEKVVSRQANESGPSDSLTGVGKRVSFTDQAWVVGERGAKENVGAVLIEHLQEHSVEPRVGDGLSTVHGAAINDFDVFQVVHLI